MRRTARRRHRGGRLGVLQRLTFLPAPVAVRSGWRTDAGPAGSCPTPRRRTTGPPTQHRRGQGCTRHCAAAPGGALRADEAQRDQPLVRHVSADLPRERSTHSPNFGKNDRSASAAAARGTASTDLLARLHPVRVVSGRSGDRQRATLMTATGHLIGPSMGSFSWPPTTPGSQFGRQPIRTRPGNLPATVVVIPTTRTALRRPWTRFAAHDVARQPRCCGHCQ